MKAKLSHFKSKKFTFALIGTVSVFLVYSSSLITLVHSPAVAAQIVNLANLAIVFLGSVTGVMLTGQSLCDWKHGSESNFNSDDKTEENLTESFTGVLARPRDFDDGTVP